jgi:hypothetical protein
LSTLLPWFSSCGGNYKLSKSEHKEMIELAKQGDVEAINSLSLHYVYSSHNGGMYRFYQYKAYEIKYSLSSNEYKQLSKYAEAGNEAAKEKLKEYQWYLDKKETLYNFLDDNITEMQQFIQICSEDDFCNSSSTYEHYSQKAKSISGNRTE